jgi:putative ABC transport system ATP-binding protein
MNGMTQPDGQPCFTIRDLRKTYAKGFPPALDVEHLDVASGEITAILGYSAAGKSTLLNILGLLDGFDEDHGGTCVRYRDLRPYHQLSEREKNGIRRTQFGFIFQSHHLVSHLSAEDNVALPLALVGVPRRQRLRRIRTLLQEAGVTSAATWGSLPSSLSGGESLRVAVLRAFCHDPQVLFADEPTGSLDPLTGAKIMGMIRQWFEQSPLRTVLLVTHNFHEAFRFAGRFILLHRGRVVFDGRKGVDVNSPGELIDRMQTGAP